MLETIRNLAGEKLEASGEGEHIRRAHADFRRLSEEWTPHLMGAAQRDWLDRLERERANLRAALDWSLKGEAAEPGADYQREPLALLEVQRDDHGMAQLALNPLAISTPASTLRARASEH